MKIVLAYSGGLDTSIILKWLIENYNAEVITFTADIGQGEEVEEARRKALQTGASKAYALDLREEFVRDFVFPMMRSGALYEGYYLLGTSIARPLIAKHLVRIAQEEGAEAIAHGATGKGNDQVRFELTAYALKPDIKVIAPWREWNLVSRPQMMEYAALHGIPVPTTLEKPYSVDSNLLHNSFEGGVLEDPWAEPPTGMFRLTQDPWQAPDEPELVEIQVEGGDVVAVNGERLSPAQLLARLNEIGGRHGIGRVDLVENRYVGMKSRGVYETPGGTLIYHARRAVESLTLDREVLHQRDQLGIKYAELVYNGFWFAPEREALQAYMDHVAKTVTGTVRFRLYKGNIILAGRKSPLSLYDKSLVSFDEKGGYNQADADGFIKLNSLRLRVRAKAQPKD
ncbi:argininosuccinate synthase [Meiothermus ruber]|uniref:argininosuccinate synthase n=1 Tax=Meiothermus ruber TaxID=277 RepID=UPI00034763EC|nr:argininosuccinate synthase [Meiothermus ruber]MCL6529344.1 argininosuccinate synthase [Meiothermus ruber]GAO76367.1 argininosuccinate synthase [Meiothermus ruber H328]GIW32314.1 MAG: argininosuccinate synthase [Meiothermus sp.]